MNLSPKSLIALFYRHLDERNYAAMPALMKKDGLWLRQGKSLSPDTMIKALEARGKDIRIHHLLTNEIVEMEGETSARYSAYMLVVKDEAGEARGGPARLDGILNIRTVRASLANTPDGWRINKLKSEPLSFARP